MATPRPRLAWTITLLGLVGCVVLALPTVDEQFYSPTALLILALFVFAESSAFELRTASGRPVFVTAGNVAMVLAVGILHPGDCFVVLFAGVAVSERTGLWSLANNTLHMAGSWFVASLLLSHASAGLVHTDVWYSVLVLGVAAVALVANYVGIHLLPALYHGGSLTSYRPPVIVWIPDLLTALLTLGTLQLYERVGVAALASALVTVLAFNYVTRLLVAADRRVHRIAELARGRAELVNQALAAEERARRRLAAELHDEGIQTLIVARQDLQAAREGDAGGAARAEEALELAIAGLRDAVFDLNPGVLEHAGLGPALEAVAAHEGRRAGLDVTVRVDPEVSSTHDRLLFAVGRELLRNAIRHADARHVELAVTVASDGVSLEVRDDGCGFDDSRRAAAVREGHVGLASSAERIEAVGGRLELESAPGAGTRVRVTVPQPA